MGVSYTNEDELVSNTAQSLARETV